MHTQFGKVYFIRCIRLQGVLEGLPLILTLSGVPAVFMLGCAPAPLREGPGHCKPCRRAVPCRGFTWLIAEERKEIHFLYLCTIWFITSLAKAVPFKYQCYIDRITYFIVFFCFNQVMPGFSASVKTNGYSLTIPILTDQGMNYLKR